MWLNYLKTASTNLIRYKSYAFITILGLVLGMSSCILIMAYVRDELGFDQWIPQADAVYRYETVSVDQSGVERLTRKSALRAKRDLLEYFPEIAQTTRVIDQSAVVSSGNQQYFETVWFADAAFMDVFRLPLLLGDRSTALADKSSMLVSASIAKKYFPDSSPLGQVLTVDGVRDFRIAGVFADIPQKSHFSPDFLLPYDQADPLYGFDYSESWRSVEGYTYARLKAGADAQAINKRLSAFRQHYSPDFVVPAGKKFSDMIKPRLLNVQDIHLDAGGIGNIMPPGNKQMLLTLSLIAALVLAIACINFVNLSTVRSLARAKEMSVRKAIGAGKIQLVWQFLWESVLVCVLAMLVSLSLVELLLPYYNLVINKHISIDFFSLTTVVSLVLAMLLGVISGLYPAFRLSGSQPGKFLRAGSGNGGKSNGWVQAILVAGQFMISSALVTTTLAVLLQQAFIENKQLGFSAERKIVIRNLGEKFARAKHDLIAAEIAKLPGVVGTAFSVATPADLVGAAFFRQASAPGSREENFPLYPKAVDANFFSVYEIPIVNGRAFSDELRTDKFYWPRSDAAPPVYASTILNASAVRASGFASNADAIGKTIKSNNIVLKIIGVVPDVNFQSLRNAVTPNMYIFSPNEFPVLTVSYAQNVDEKLLLEKISAVWKTMVPGIPLKAEFLQDNIRAQYAQDRQQFLLIAIFASLAISIACMGLYALASFSTQRRTKEIGIRKVHGALSSDILQLLLLQFSKPIVLANLLACPLALYAMRLYLGGFQYRIEPGPSIFVVSGVVILLIAWAAIIFHVAKVAHTRPVLVLKHE